MLFNSYHFIFIFLPLVWVTWAILQHYKKAEATTVFLLAASLFFYSYWSAKYLLLLLASIAFNFFISRYIKNKASLILAIAINLTVLIYFKYTNFLALQFGMNINNIILPIGISFFTFQQIAYLVDNYKNPKKEKSFCKYALFVTFFPHLIAGPIVHHKEMLPQFSKLTKKLSSNLAIGLSLFALGLFKKVVIADTFSRSVTPLFSLVNQGYHPTFFESWGAALCYTFQIYFDFSGYSDMACGLAFMFGIKLPINFASPYKATSFIDFWRRWHITLSRLIRDYIYIPLGGNKKGKFRESINIFVTMLLAGIWHGAGWSFILWGAIHGALIALNRLWRWLNIPALPKLISIPSVFIIIVLTWVPFRAESINSAIEIYKGMAGLHGIIFPFESAIYFELLPQAKVQFSELNIDVMLAVPQILIGLIIVWWLPNSFEWMRNFTPALSTKGYPASAVKPDKKELSWQPTLAHATTIAFLIFLSLIMINDASEFLYFQF